MIVLSVYYTDKPGGFCKRLYRLFRALARASHTVHYCSLDLPQQEAAASVIFHRIPFWTERRTGLLFWGTFVLWCPIFLAWTARKIAPDRYAVFGAFYSAMLFFARRAHRAPLILFLRSLVFEIDRITKKPAWIRAIAGCVERIGLGNASVVVCMTRAMEDAVRNFAGRSLRKVEILPNDLPPPSAERRDLRELLPVRYSAIALTSGVLDARKNVAVLLSAWKEAATNLPANAWGLVVAGKGPLEPSLIERAQTLGLSTVHFVGWIPNLEQFLASAQLVLHPSKHEGVSNSLLEAAAAGVPVLVSDIPEHREFFSAPELLCAENGWGAALKNFLHDKNALSRLRTQTGRCAAILRFDWDSRAVALICAANL